MAQTSVVVTGIGVLASNGLGREAYWKALLAGRSGIGPVTRFDTSRFPCQIGGELRDFNPEDFMSKSQVKNWHRHVHQAVASARMAVEDSGVASAKYEPDRMACAVGTSVGNPNEAYEWGLETFETHGYKKLPKMGSSAFASHSATVHVSIDFGLRGPAITIASGCATGIDVMGWGLHQIRSGHVDAAVIGATESPLFPMSFATASALGILSKRNDAPEQAMRPFDRTQDGIVLSEGAATLVLERADYARARGARIYGEVAGFGSAAEGLNPLILDKEGNGLSRAILASLGDAGATADEVDHIQSHGVSLEMYDRCEANAYRNVFGARLPRIPVAAVKSMIGQAYSAGGLLGVAAGLMTLEQGAIPPIINLDEPNPEYNLDLVAPEYRFCDIHTVLSVAMSFGGTHSAVVLRSLN